MPTFKESQRLRRSHPELDTLDDRPDLRYRINDTALMTIMPHVRPEQIEDVLERELNIRKIYKRCCAVSGIDADTPAPLDVIVTQGGIGVERLGGRTWNPRPERSEAGDTYRIEELSTAHYSRLCVGIDILNNIQGDEHTRNMAEVSMAHECFHLIFNRHPKVAAEWIAGYGADLYSRIYGVASLNQCRNASVVASDPRSGFYLGPHGDSNNVKMHSTVEWSGVDALRNALGIDEEQRLQNLRRMAEVCHIPGHTVSSHPNPEVRQARCFEQPTIDVWLGEIDQRIPGFERSMRNHACMRPAHGDNVVLSPLTAGNGCVLQRFDIEVDPNYGVVTVPIGQPPPGVEAVGRQVLKKYQDLPLRCVIDTDDGQSIEANSTPTGGKLIITGSGLADLLKGQGRSDAFDTFKVRVPGMDGHMQEYGPFTRTPFADRTEQDIDTNRIHESRDDTSAAVRNVVRGESSVEHKRKQKEKEQKRRGKNKKKEQKKSKKRNRT